MISLYEKDFVATVGIRTGDFGIKSPHVNQLSYLGFYLYNKGRDSTLKVILISNPKVEGSNPGDDNNIFFANAGFIDEKIFSKVFLRVF